MATKKTTSADQTKKKTSASKKTAGKTETRKTTASKNSSRQSAAKKDSSNRGRQTKSSGARAKTESRAKRQSVEVPDISRRKKTGTPVWAEILLWVILAFCIILFLGTVFEAGGTTGKAISGFFFGIFGIMAYAQPVILFFITAFLIANRGRKQAWMKILAVTLLVMSLCCFFTLVSEPVSSSVTVNEYYTISRNTRSGGGLAGGMIYSLFHAALGEIGTWICNMILFMISMILLTGYSIFDSIRSEGGDAIGQARTRKQMQRELNHQRKTRSRLEEQAQMQRKIDEIRQTNHSLAKEIREPRRERIVTGVSKNTTFDMNLPVSEEIHEVVPKVSQRQNSTVSSVLDPSCAKKAKEAVPELKDTAPVAKKETEKETAAVPELNFTIQRNGSSQMISSATTVPTTASREPALGMPEFLQEAAARKSERVQAADAVKESVISDKKIVLPKEEDDSLQENVRPKGDTDCELPEAAEEITARTKIRNPHSSKEEQEEAVDSVAEEIKQNEEIPKAEYVFPPLDLLKKPSGSSGGNSNDEVTETARKLQETLHSFGVNVTVTNVSCGPAVTRYELQPEQGVKVSRIVSLADDIKLNLAAEDIRIEAPIPGKAAVGIEVPNKENSAVYLRELLESDEFQNARSDLSFAVGKDIAGKAVVTDIAKMPHLLIAGATGSGKSVCINTLIMSIIYKANPEDVKLIMIDPKVVELSVYNGIPHLFIPVVTDPKKASGALNWGVAEMTDRYQKFADAGVRDLKGYNAKVEQLADIDTPDKPKKLPQIVIIVDELADLMMVAPGEVEDAICRLAQLARAAGIHLIIATQRPSVNVITGLIKANMPSRIAFSVTSGVDSRTILDMTGAEKLLGKGDMLFYPQGYSKPVRVQGSFVSDAEVSKVTEFLTQKNDMSVYHKQMEARMNTVAQSSPVSLGGASGGNELDAHFVEAGKFIIEKDKASIGMLQRVFKIGFNRAARIMDQLSEAGVVGPEEGTKPRKVLMSMEEFEQYIDEYC